MPKVVIAALRRDRATLSTARSGLPKAFPYMYLKGKRVKKAVRKISDYESPLGPAILFLNVDVDLTCAVEYIL